MTENITGILLFPELSVHRLSPTSAPYIISSTAKLFAEVFLARETTTVSLLSSLSDSAAQALGASLHAYARIVTAECAEAGLSYIVCKDSDKKNKESAEVVAIFLATPYDPEASEPPVPSGFEPTFTLLHDLGAAYDAQVHQSLNLKQDKTLELFIGAVSSAYAGKHLPASIVPLLLANARAFGYTSVVARCTSISQIVLGKMGFEARVKIRYDAFVYEGKRVFAGIGFPESAALMWKSLVNDREEVKVKTKSKL